MNQGNVDHTSPFHPNPYPWSAFHSDDYGYLRMSILNSTHLHLEQISVNKVCLKLQLKINVKLIA